MKTGSRVWRYGLLAVLLVSGSAPPLYAASLADAVEFCAQQPDDAKRLACYDGVAGRAVTQAAPDPASGSVAKPVAVPAATAAPAPAGSPAASRPSGTAAAPASAEITASITQLSRRADGRYLITLSNGDRWLEAELKERFWAQEGETVSVRTELLGAHYLRTQHGIDVRVSRP